MKTSLRDIKEYSIFEVEQRTSSANRRWLWRVRQRVYGLCRPTQAFYVSWAPRFTLPPEEFEKAYKVEFDRLSKANPVVWQFTPSLSRFRWAEAYEQTLRALLHTQSPFG